MKHRIKMKIISVVFLSLLLFSNVASSAEGGGGEETENEREFDYDERSKKGPTNWGSLKKEWTACNNGEMQSPIDLSEQKVRVFQTGEGRDFISRRDYKSATATLKNRGHDISIQWAVGEAGSIIINGTRFFLHQAHWHSPSEHFINGKRYDMEMHLVHVKKKKKNNHLAVIGVLFQIGQPDPFLSQLMEKISTISDKQVESFIGLVDPKQIEFKDSYEFYRYMGSLTIPPCTEGVIWTIAKHVKTVSMDQIELLRGAVHDYAKENARPIQQLNNREISSYSNLYERTDLWD